ncbi:MAG: hypothetical protein ACO3EY_05465 [Candidatus Nanopelagicales bacterium]
MATAAYISGRKRYQRPQGILWSENAGTLVDGLYVPTGQEIGADPALTSGGVDQFLILSDHNRTEMSFNSERIEKRERTINGRMRSYHIADKLTMSVSWNNLPSRGYSELADFSSTGSSPNKNTTGEFTSDGGAGGVEVLDWYENHQGPFWMFLAYDKYKNFGTDNSSFNNLGKYNQIIQVYFADFNYSVVKRGGTNHDLWNISVTLEEV